MHGRRTCCIGAIAFLLAGCLQDEEAGPPRLSESPAVLGTAFDPAQAGTLVGRVMWQGRQPAVDPFRVPAPSGLKVIANPNQPRINEQTSGVHGAVVYLRGVDLAHSKPWDLPPVGVEHRNESVEVRQGDSVAQVGFVRRGHAVDIASREPIFNCLQARGAAFFSVPLPEPDRPTRRILHTAGLVELSSGAGHYWQRAYLFVSDHPYCTRTDADGSFCLTKIPAGPYEVVAWVPNWHVAGTERHPESSQVWRLAFQPPVEEKQWVTIQAGRDTAVVFSFTEGLFGR